MRLSLLLMLIFMGTLVSAQTDSIKVLEDREDGIYLSYHDFRRNIFISKGQVKTDLKKDQLDFMAKVLASEKISYTSLNGAATAESKNVWGFYQNKTLYVNYREEFFRIPVFGSICYLVATVTVVNSGLYDPMFGYGVNANRTKEIREFIMNFYDGTLNAFSMETAEALLSRDAPLFAEYKALSRRSRKEQVNRFIRRFNETHPVYFLIK